MLMVVAWLVYALQSFRVFRPLYAALVAVLTYQFQIGQLSLSLGSIVAFAAAIWAAFWLARTIRLVLAEDLLPSLALPRGVGNSISTLSYYSVLFLGLLAALATAGLADRATGARLRRPGCRHRYRTAGRGQELRLGADPDVRAADPAR